MPFALGQKEDIRYQLVIQRQQKNTTLLPNDYVITECVPTKVLDINHANNLCSLENAQNINGFNMLTMACHISKTAIFNTE